MTLNKMIPLNNLRLRTIAGILSAIVAIPILVNCGGAISNLGNVSANLSGEIAGTGIFRDSTVAGLTFVTPTKTGVTGTDGVFDYQQNENVTFSIGGVELGGTKSKAVITPVDFATQRSTNSVMAKNISRFLLMLDNDGDPQNGIVISQAVQDIAQNWSQVDFATSDLNTALTNIISDVNSVDSPPVHVLPDDATAKAHLDETLLCTYGGAFQGQLAGDDSGHFGFVIEANPNRATAGMMSGFLFSNALRQTLVVNGLTPAVFDDASTYAQPTSETLSGRTITLRYTSLDSVDGNWTEFQGTGFGTFAGGRIGRGQGDIWHFVGKYVPDPAHPEWDEGIFAFSFLGAAQDSIAGDSFSMNDADQYALTGVLAGNTNLDMTTSDGKQWTGLAVTNPASAAYGVTSGDWEDSNSGQSGTFQGTGCKRN